MTLNGIQSAEHCDRRLLTKVAEPPTHLASPTREAAPITHIEPSQGWVDLDLRELWTYRELLYFLIWRDLKIRYKQTVLGAAWAVIQPFFTMIVFSLFFGRLAKVPSDGLPYPVFSYAALLPWMFFASAVTNAANSVITRGASTS